MSDDFTVRLRVQLREAAIREHGLPRFAGA